MFRGSIQWRGDTYVLDNSTWLFWGGAHFVEDVEGKIRLLTLEDQLQRVSLSIDVAALVVEEDDTKPMDTWTYLKDQGVRLWSITDALAIVREDADTELAERGG